MKIVSLRYPFQIKARLTIVHNNFISVYKAIFKNIYLFKAEEKCPVECKQETSTKRLIKINNETPNVKKIKVA